MIDYQPESRAAWRWINAWGISSAVDRQLVDWLVRHGPACGERIHLGGVVQVLDEWETTTAGRRARRVGLTPLGPITDAVQARLL